MTDRISVFHCGTQHADWVSRNCSRCWKYDPDGPPDKCEIDIAIMESMCGDGKFTPEMVKRMGYDTTNGFPYTWDCPECEEEQPNPDRGPIDPNQMDLEPLLDKIELDLLLNTPELELLKAAVRGGYVL